MFTVEIHKTIVGFLGVFNEFSFLKFAFIDKFCNFHYTTYNIIHSEKR